MIGGPVARHTITLIRALGVDDGRGGLDYDWDAATETPSAGWAIDAGGGTDDTENRDGASVEYTLRGPFAADVLPSDRVRLYGDVFVISGGVARQPGPTPRTSHTILKLVRWEG